MPVTGSAIDWPRTLAARGADVLAVPHLRRRARVSEGGVLHCFVLDCSASMLANGKLARAKGVLLVLMEEAYRQRDPVALLCFGGTTVELRVAPQRAAAWNDAWIAPIAGGGGTPLALGLREADRLLARTARQRAPARSRLWLLTDGRTSEIPPRPISADGIVVVDFEDARGALDRARALADVWTPCTYLPSTSFSRSSEP